MDRGGGVPSRNVGPSDAATQASPASEPPERPTACRAKAPRRLWSPLAMQGRSRATFPLGAPAPCLGSRAPLHRRTLELDSGAARSQLASRGWLRLLGGHLRAGAFRQLSGAGCFLFHRGCLLPVSLVRWAEVLGQFAGDDFDLKGCGSYALGALGSSGTADII